MHKLLALGGGVAAMSVAAIGAAPAAAAYTITGGPNFNGAASATTFTDTATTAVVTCPSSTIGGIVTPGTVPGPAIGSATGLTFGAPCPGSPSGFTAAAASLPFGMSATGTPSGGIVSITITGVDVTLTSFICTVRIAGNASGTYNDGTHRLIFSGGTLHVASSTGCLGLFSVGDHVTLGATYTLTGSPTNPIQIT